MTLRRYNNMPRKTVIKYDQSSVSQFYLVYEYCESSVYETINHLHSLREGVNKTVSHVQFVIFLFRSSTCRGLAF